MTQLLPRAYWCHADFTKAELQDGPLADFTTSAPGEAVEWVREAVRAVTPSLEREVFHAVWGWLGNHPSVSASIRELRRGQQYSFTAEAPAGRWKWTAYPVSLLPMAEPDCPRREMRKSAPVGAISGPP